MSEQRVSDERLRELCEAATPGPWSQGMIGDDLIAEVDYAAAFGLVVVDPAVSDDGAAGVHDAAFIAAARTAVPDLLDRLAAAAKVLPGLAERVDALVGTDPLNAPDPFDNVFSRVALVELVEWADDHDKEIRAALDAVGEKPNG